MNEILQEWVDIAEEDLRFANLFVIVWGCPMWNKNCAVSTAQFLFFISSPAKKSLATVRSG